MNKEILSEINRFREIIGLKQINESVTGTSPIYEALEKFWEKFGVRGIEKSELESLERALSTDANLVRDFDEIGTKLSNPATIRDGENLLNNYLTNLSGFQRLITILDRAAPDELNAVLDKTFKSRMGIQYDNFVQAYQLDGNNGMRRMYDALTPSANRSQRLEYLLDKWKPEPKTKGGGGTSGGGTSGGGTSGGGTSGGGIGGLKPNFGVQDLIEYIKVDPEYGQFFKKSGVETKFRDFLRLEMKRTGLTAEQLLNDKTIFENYFAKLQIAIENGTIKTGGLYRKVGDFLASIPTSDTAKKALGLWILLVAGGVITVAESWSYIKKLLRGESKTTETPAEDNTTPSEDNTTPSSDSEGMENGEADKIGGK